MPLKKKHLGKLKTSVAAARQKRWLTQKPDHSGAPDGVTTKSVGVSTESDRVSTESVGVSTESVGVSTESVGVVTDDHSYAVRTDRVYAEVGVQTVETVKTAPTTRSIGVQTGKTLKETELSLELANKRVQELVKQVIHLRKHNPPFVTPVKRCQDNVSSRQNQRKRKKLHELTAETSSLLNLSEEKKLLSPDEALQLRNVCALSNQQMKKLKRNLAKKGLNIFPSVLEIKESEARFIPKTMFRCSKVTIDGDQRISVVVSDVRNLLEERLELFISLDWIKLEGRKEIKLGIHCDSGQGSTKLAISFLDCSGPNSASRLTIVGLYEGDDGSSNLRVAFQEVISSLNALKLLHSVAVRFFLIGDAKFLRSAFGMQSCSAKFFCLWCYTTLDQLRSRIVSKSMPDLRSSQSIADDAAVFRNLSPEAQNKASHKQVCRSTVSTPLFEISPDHAVVPILHVFIGLVTRVYKRVADTACQRRLESVLKELKVDLKAYQGGTFTGNHCLKLIQKKGPALLSSCVTDSAMAETIKGILSNLGHIQPILWATRTLQNSEICEIRQKIPEIVELWSKLDINPPPKLHFLSCHVLPFVEKWRTIGLFSEQSIETLHQRLMQIGRLYQSDRDPCNRYLSIIERHYGSM